MTGISTYTLENIISPKQELDKLEHSREIFSEFLNQLPDTISKEATLDKFSEYISKKTKSAPR